MNEALSLAAAALQAVVAGGAAGMAFYCIRDALEIWSSGELCGARIGHPKLAIAGLAAVAFVVAGTSVCMLIGAAEAFSRGIGL